MIDIGCQVTNVEAKDIGIRKNISIDRNTPTICSKYILLTTQKSGSTWVCNLLDQQDNISCGGEFNDRGFRTSELLMRYSKLRNEKASVIWSEYKEDLDNAFQSVCDDNPSLLTGFKLMYDQIPYQFIQDGHLQTYFKENQVSIIHLVREAKILNIASKYNSNKQKEALGLKFMHSTNSSMIKSFRAAEKMPWDEKTITDILELEKLSAKWQKSVHFMYSVPDHYLSYESLLMEDDRAFQLTQILAFLQILTDMSNTVKVNSPLLRLHESTCSDRVENYSTLHLHPKLESTGTLLACDMIENYIT